MNTLLKSIADHHATILALTGVVVIILAAALVKLSANLREIRGRWSQLLNDASGKNVELLLQDHLRERLKLQSELEEAERRIQTLESKMSTAKRHLGIVRFDAFDDVGGSQSFALAMYDDSGNGVVLNGLIGRADCRVYAKPLVNLRSDRTLSQEEVRAIEEAQSKAPRAVVTT